MARRVKNRNKKNAIPQLKKKISSRKLFVTLVLLIILAVSFILIRNYLCASPEFLIKEVELQGRGLADSYLFNELSKIALGENIFSISIKGLENSIKNDYFEVKDVRVKRVFPNKLVLYIDKRIAVAQVDSRYYYPVDNERMILKDAKRTIHTDLPVIRGIYLSRGDIGKKHKSSRLSKALMLLEELSKSGILESHSLSEVDASNAKNLSFYIDDGLEIKIGGEDFKERLALLEKILSDPAIDLRGIRYIDLRFKDVIIGPK